MKKRILALVLTLALCVGTMSVVAHAAAEGDTAPKADVELKDGTITVTNGAEGTYIVTVVGEDGKTTFVPVQVGADGTGTADAKKPDANDVKHNIPGLSEKPTDPGTDPTDPGTDPTDPGTDPTDPGTDPSNPGTNPGPGWYPSTPSNPSYSVSAPSSIPNGSVSLSSTSAKKGDTVTITVKPNDGYKLDKLTVTDANGNNIQVRDQGNNKYAFTMPDSKVNVSATFAADAPAPQVTFVDVPSSAFYADAVAWAVEKGITNGTSASTFSPNNPCTRSEIVTFLWRANGSPKASATNIFVDVDPNAFYYDAVLWAVANGITNGTSATTFSPYATCTRGEAVTFLHRANGKPAASGGTFSDVASSAFYANAVSWAVSKGVTNGTSTTTFSPSNTCTRGEIVTFLYRDMA